MTTTEAYHDFLLRQRLFCEHPGCFDKLTRATVVRNMNGRDTCFCAFHGRSLSAIRGQRTRKDLRQFSDWASDERKTRKRKGTKISHDN